MHSFKSRIICTFISGLENFLLKICYHLFPQLQDDASVLFDLEFGNRGHYFQIYIIFNIFFSF